MLVTNPVGIRSWRAALDLGYERASGRTVLATRRHDGPLVVQKPLYPEGGEVCHTIVVHPPGGIAGGDELAIAARAGEGAHVLFTTPGAGKWYRSNGPWASQRIALRAAAGAAAEWLPQETIVFDGARAQIDLEVELAQDAVFIGWEILCLGRRGSGERFGRGVCRLQTRVQRAGDMIWFERGAIEAGGTFCISPAGLARRTVCATLIAAGEGVSRALLDACRAEPEPNGAVTLVPGVLIARYIGDSSEAAKRYFHRLWRHVRPALTGRAACPPRIWST